MSVTVTLTVVFGTADPGPPITLALERPDGSVTLSTFGVDANITRTSAGHYSGTFVPDEPGANYPYRWSAPGYSPTDGSWPTNAAGSAVSLPTSPPAAPSAVLSPSAQASLFIPGLAEGGMPGSLAVVQATAPAGTVAVLTPSAQSGKMLPGLAEAGIAGSVAVVQPVTTSTVIIPGNPPNTSIGVHAAAMSSFDSAHMLTTTPQIEAVWNWNSGSPGGVNAGIWKGEYFPIDRQPDIAFNVNSQPLSWFQTNHPDWIEYRRDQVTVAYAFGQTGDIPLDVANPACAAYLRSTFYGPAAASGTYQHLDFDNFQMRNAGPYSGLRAGHFDLNGNWVPQFQISDATGNNDPEYRAYMIAIAQSTQAWLHANYPNVAFAANYSYDDSFPADSDSLLTYVDVLMDEQGFTNGNNAPPWKYTDATWLHKAQHMSTYLARGSGWFDVNSNAESFATLTTADKLWCLANYLLFKNSASWIWMGGPTEYHVNGVLVPEYANTVIGAPTNSYFPYQNVYRRDFATGVVLVNPSSTTNFSLTNVVPSNTYKDVEGVTQPASFTLAAQSGQILVHL